MTYFEMNFLYNSEIQGVSDGYNALESKLNYSIVGIPEVSSYYDFIIIETDHDLFNKHSDEYKNLASILDNIPSIEDWHVNKVSSKKQKELEKIIYFSGDDQ